MCVILHSPLWPQAHVSKLALTQNTKQRNKGHFTKGNTERNRLHAQHHLTLGLYQT